MINKNKLSKQRIPFNRPINVNRNYFGNIILLTEVNKRQLTTKTDAFLVQIAITSVNDSGYFWMHLTSSIM